MSYSAPEHACFLVEWYGQEATERPLDETVGRLVDETAALRAEGTAVRLLVALAAPSDHVLYSVFAASSSDTVRRACERAGLPAERVTVGIDARLVQDERWRRPGATPEQGEVLR